MTSSVFNTMGTIASLKYADPADSTDTVEDEIKAAFLDADRRYSLYSPTSEISSIADGSLHLSDASPQLRHVYAEALDWRNRTNGAFTPHRPDGIVDLSGIVKALAIQRAFDILHRKGLSNWCLNVGGDVLTDGTDNGTPWLVGIVNPDDRRNLIGAITVDPSKPALATSGSAERGEHIWLASSRSNHHFVQVTVAAADIVTADVLATAAISAGPTGLDDITERFPIDVLTIDSRGTITATPRMQRALGLDVDRQTFFAQELDPRLP